MMRCVVTAAMVVCLFGMDGCVSEREGSLYLETQARAEIQQVRLDRESAAELTPIEHKLAARILLIDGVQECVCVLHPLERETERLLADGKTAYGREREVRIIVVLTEDREERLSNDDETARNIVKEKVARQIRDSGVAEFTLERPMHVHNTWIIYGSTPAMPVAATSTRPAM